MDINAQVEREINEQSSFNPMDWLIDNGRLMYGDYEKWRNGDIHNLDDCLLGNVKKISQQLTLAISHAESLGMVKEDVRFSAWTGSSTSPLTISRSSSLAQLLSCRLIRVNDTPQLDLFFDNPVVFIENGLRDALSSRNLEQAQRLLNQLSEQDPNHKQLSQFENLVAYAAHMSNDLVSQDSSSGALFSEELFLEELSGLEDIIEPLAKDCLLEKARDFVIPAWRRLAFAQEGIDFDASNPKHHASYSWKKALDWTETKKSVETVGGYKAHYDLCHSLASAEYFLQHRENSFSLWCQLCWLNADKVEEDIQIQPDYSLLETWNRFIDQDEEMAPVWFPAWLLLSEPGLAHHIQPEPTDEDSFPAQQAFNILLTLFSKKHADTEEMELRKQLNNIEPRILNLYQRRVSS